MAVFKPIAERLFIALAALGAPTLADARLDPVGTWSCLIYGPPSLGDERVLFQIEPDGSAEIARLEKTDTRGWAPMSQWERKRNELIFSDLRTGRQFEADLGRATLGGVWQTHTLSGGWWCTSYEGSTEDLPSSDLADDDPLMPPLVPSRMATPNYPRQAIREAKEGRVVACFLVSPSGAISEPEIIEISDEIFRHSALNALSRSRYVGWNEVRGHRPGCRSYIYRLDSRR
jgi:hypothetical protein